MGQDFMPLIPEVEHEQVKRHFAALSPKTPVKSIEHRVLVANGELCWQQWTNRAFFDQSGNVVEYQSVGRDITERKQAEKELRGQQELLSNILSNIPHSVFWKDRNSVYLGCNQNFTREAGIRTSQEVIGKTDYDLAWKKEETEFYRQCDREVMERGEPLLNIEEPQLQADGREATLLTSKVPLRDQAGRVVGILGIYADITERKRAEEALRESEEKYRGLFEQAADSILLIDNRSGAFAEFNDRAHQNLGYTRDEFQKLTIADIEVIESAEEVAAHIQKILEEGGDTFETKHRTKNGKIRDVLVNAKVISIHGQEFFQSIWRDVTEQKRAEAERAGLEDQLRQAQKMEAVGTLASGIAHDFNNLLTAIFGYTELAKTTLPDDHQAIRSLEMVEQSAEQARGVTNALLTFTHKKVTEKSPINLVKTVQLATGLLRRVLPASVELIEDLPGEPEIWVNGDATQLQQVVMNLAVNARDAMPDGGRLGIRLHQQEHEPGHGDGSAAGSEGREAALVVEDSGTGMSEEVKSRVFEPFFTTKPRGQGTGLGLSVIHGIVRDHGGTVRIDSQPGGGTRVTVLLPRCDPAEAATARWGRPARISGQGELILVVEDNEHVRSIMVSMLRSHGYRVIPAADGAQAVALFDAHLKSVRLVVLDLDLPKTTGFSLLREARWRKAGIPLLVVTGTVGIPVEEERGPRANWLLRKPFQMADLVAMVARALESRPHEGSRA